MADEALAGSRFDFAVRDNGIGADVSGIDLRTMLTADEVAQISAALARYRVLFFHDQHIDTAQQIAIGRQFGKLEIHQLARKGRGRAIQRDPRWPELVVVESTPDNPAVAEVWHSDVSFREMPSLGSLLRMTHKPHSGGDTLWADMAAAYEGLDDRTRHLVDDAVAIHDWPGFRRDWPQDPESLAELAALQAEFPPVEHPVIRTHPVTGERLIYVNAPFTMRIKGMSDAESQRTLAHLFAQADNPDYHVRLRWEPGDIAFWDNRGTQHSVSKDVVGHRRLERVTIIGDRPF